MVETNADANEALSRANKEANDGLNQLRSNFALAVQMFQNQVTRDIEASSTKTHSFFEKLVSGVDVAVQSMLSKMGSTLRGMESDASILSEVSQSRKNIFTTKRLSAWLTRWRMFAKPTRNPWI